MQGLGLALVNLYTKFEVSISTCYEDMKGNVKFRKCDSLGHLGVAQVIENSII